MSLAGNATAPRVLSICFTLLFSGAAIKAEAVGNARFGRILETLIKMAETRLATRPDYQTQEASRRYLILLDDLSGRGVSVPAATRERVLPPDQLAAAILAPIPPAQQAVLVERLRGSLAGTLAVPPPPGVSPPHRPAATGPLPDHPPTFRTAQTLAWNPTEGSSDPALPPPAIPINPALAGDDTSAVSYVLGATDVIELVYLDPEIAPDGKINASFVYVINLEGKVVLPLLGVTHVAGFTVAQLRVRLKELYRRFIQNPRITVFVKAYNSQKVYVMGQSGNAKIVNLSGSRTTLFEVLTRVGGYGESGDPEHILIFRGNKRMVVNFKKHLDDPVAAEEFVVLPGDRIVIPRPTSNVTILGGVNKSGEYPFTDGMTLLKLVAMAGSFNDNARRERIKIIRRAPARRPARGGNSSLASTETINVDALSILRGKSSDLFLKPHDTIYVDEW